MVEPRSDVSAAETSRRRKKGALWGAGAALGGVLGVGALVGQAWTADDLTPKAEDGLAAAGYGDITVEFTGREAVLSGTGTEADFDAARGVVEDVRGVRRVEVDDEVEVGAEPELPALSINVGADGVSLAGAVPNAELADGITAALGEATGTDVSGELTVDPDAEAPSWLAGLPAAMGELGPVGDLELNLDGDRLTIIGEVASEAHKAEIEAAVANHLPPPLAIDYRLDVAGLTAADVAEQLADKVVQFDRNEDGISPEGADVLDEIVGLMTEAPDVSIQIEGHTSAIRSGRAAVAERISQERADAVFDYLVEAGADPDRLTAVARGEDDPVGDNETDEGREQNRRTTFSVTEGSD